MDTWQYAILLWYTNQLFDVIHQVYLAAYIYGNLDRMFNGNQQQNYKISNKSFEKRWKILAIDKLTADNIFYERKLHIEYFRFIMNNVLTHC